MDICVLLCSAGKYPKLTMEWMPQNTKDFCGHSLGKEKDFLELWYTSHTHCNNFIKGKMNLFLKLKGANSFLGKECKGKYVT